MVPLALMAGARMAAPAIQNLAKNPAVQDFAKGFGESAAQQGGQMGAERLLGNMLTREPNNPTMDFSPSKQA